MLSAVYIKGFKTFARPVRMPLEGGVTAVVGPNGAGKSNITDAVLFALGEQSPGLLRAGAMGDLIFSGSESLPATDVAEVTLVFDNSSGGISLPYEEVSLTRRISREEGTEYRINGAGARLADVRSVAGEAGLGRHSILRQGAVDAIVSGGAEACRQALEEAAGLGVYRRRRLSASRRLEKAEAQLEQSRHIEAGLSEQLRRIEREAVAAREYREVEAKYRRLSLAHLYRVASRELDELRMKLDEGEREVARLSAREGELREEERGLERDLSGAEVALRDLEMTVERLDEVMEGLREGASRADRNAFRIEAGRENQERRRRSARHLEAEAKRVREGLRTLRASHERARELDEANRLTRDERARSVKQARERVAVAERERSRLSSTLEGVRARLDGLSTASAHLVSEETIVGVGEASARLDAVRETAVVELAEGSKKRAAEVRREIWAREAGVNRRRGVLSAAVGRFEARVRSLTAPEGGSRAVPRLHEVVRARPGFEFAVEAALGDFGAGIFARDAREGVGMLSETERVAVRLDACEMEDDGGISGTPLLECVEVLDERYAGAVERLLGGIYLVEDAASEHLSGGGHANGHVAVTREGIRLTRTSVSLAAAGRFAREARLAAARNLFSDLEAGPAATLDALDSDLAAAAERHGAAVEAGLAFASLLGRVGRARTPISREARRRLTTLSRSRDRTLDRRRTASKLSEEAGEGGAALSRATAELEEARGSLSAATASRDEALVAAEDSGRELRRLRAEISDGARRIDDISSRLDVARSLPDTGRARLAGRVVETSVRLSETCAARRGAVRLRRAQSAEAYRNTSSRRTDLARRVAEHGSELASAGNSVERIQETLRRREGESSEAEREIHDEWGATLDEARKEAETLPEDIGEERGKLARRLKRFGDVNLLSLSQEAEIRERHEEISAQRADAEEAASELSRIIHTIDEEIETRFSETFGRVSRTFGGMVPRMMAGASGTLELSEEGVEIGLRLGRKGWRSLKVLSGGERSLLALSFLFGILLSKGDTSRTFCILDEAEAALDDINLARFLSVVDSQRERGQFLLVTHQKRTMAAADVLYGVVQDASGATSVVSKRIQGDQVSANGTLMA